MNTLDQIKNFVSKEVTLSGWLYNMRSSGKISFLQFRDGTGTIQAVVVKSDVKDKVWDDIQKLNMESSIEITGLLKEDKRAPSGYELELKDLKIIQLAPDDYPIGKKEHGPGFLLDHRHFWLRSPRQRAVQLIRHTIIQAIYDFYYQNGFVKIDTPIFTPSACEGTTDLFEVDYFGEPAYLSQSGQLYLEACLPSLRKVFDFSPVFRAEKSKTRRHLTEFWMNNAEAAFVDLEQSLILQEELITHVIKQVLSLRSQELNVLERNTSKLESVKPPFPRLTHKEAVERLRSLGSKIGERDDLGAEDETLLATEFDQPVFVTHYPAEVKAFYMKRNTIDSSRADCADLIAPEGHGEIIGGSERETDYDTLLQSIKQHNLPINDFRWYLDQRRYGSVVHSGFGIGLERVVKWICNLHHVRETIPFPRMLNRLRP